MLKIKNYKNVGLEDYEVSLKDAVKIGKLKEGEKASIMSDVMFRTMFQNESRIKYSAKLLSYILDMSYEDLLNNMHLSKNILDKKKRYDKQESCDYVVNIDGSYVNIEVNNNSSMEVMERNVEYASRIFSKRVKQGNRYNYQQVIQINLNNFAYKGNNKIIDIYGIQNDEGVKLTKKITFIQIYIPNLRKKCYTSGIERLNELERYILALIEPNIEEAKRYIIGDKIMEEYIDESIEVSEDENFGESYDKVWAIEDQAKRVGKEEGLKEVASKMLGEKFDVDIIAKTTGLSKEEIKELSIN